MKAQANKGKILGMIPNAKFKQKKHVKKKKTQSR